MKFKFTEDFANNWRKEQVVNIVCIDENFLVDGVALVPKQSLLSVGIFLSDNDDSDNDYDDYFGGLSVEEYKKETEEHMKYIEHICKCDYERAGILLDRFKTNLFACEFISDEDAEMLYHTILNWKDKSEMYDSLCE